MTFVNTGAVYVDNVEGHHPGGAATVAIANTFPYDQQTNVPAGDHLGSHPLLVSVFDVSSAGMNHILGDPHVTISVTTVEDGAVVVWDGTAFAVGWSTSSTWETVSSDGIIAADEHRFVLVRDTPFTSLDTIIVDVHGVNNDEDFADLVYSFQVEDLTAPVLVSAETRTLTRVRVTFDEPMEQGTGTAGDVLFVLDISGGVTLQPRNGAVPPRVLLPEDLAGTAVAGMYVGVANSDHAVNNGYFLITAVPDARTIEIDNERMIAEVLPLDSVVTVTPYNIAGVPDVRRLNPFFNPIIIGAETVSAATVELVLHTDITQSRLYELTVSHANDVWGNQLSDASVEFTTEACPVPATRDFDWLQLIPPGNLAEDATGDLERVLRCWDEVAQLLLCDVDAFGDVLDIDSTPLIDALLVSLGSPFSFTASLSETDKRRLADILVETYKRNGIEVGMEGLAAYLTGVTVDIRPYLGGAYWILGESELGDDTELGPGTQFLVYSFESEADAALSDTQRRRFMEIVDYMKPAHTHHVRLIEP